MCDHPRKPSSRPTAQRAAGFTLIETLVVIAVIMILIAMLLPALRKVKTTTNRMTCSAQIKQITLGILILADEDDGKFPPHDSNPTDVSNDHFNLKPKLRSVVPVVKTFYCPSTGGKNNASLIERWDDPSWNNQQHGTDYPIWFNAVNVAFTLRTSIYEVEHPSSEVLMGDFVYTASWYPWNPGLEHLFTPGVPFWANHPVGEYCGGGDCGPGVPPAGANWGAYDGHVQWRHVKELRYLGWGGAGPWQWYN
jgi:Tfp pilus assembly protein PilV